MKDKIGVVSIYSICHFIIDFICAIFILGKLPYIAETNNEFIISVIIYNFFAFAFQVPLGYIMDKFRTYKYIAIIGVCFIGICYLINFGNAIILASIVGIGNALFHLEGGVNIYSLSKRKAFINGLFVAPGALGIFLGTTFHNELIITYLPMILVFLAIVLLSLVQKQEINKTLKESKKSDIFNLRALFIIVLLGISIIVRAIGGSAIIYTWKSGFVLSFLYTIVIVLGKAFGGLIADKFGLIKMALISLSCAAIFLILGENIHILAYIGIFLFNIPMSITLTILENVLVKKIACAVGLNTMFLFIGYVICFIDITVNNNFIFVLSVLLAMLSIYFVKKLYLKGGSYNEKA